MRAPFNQKLHTYLTHCDGLHFTDEITDYFDNLRSNADWLKSSPFLLRIALENTWGFDEVDAVSITNMILNHYISFQNDYDLYDHARFSDDFEQDPFPMDDSCSSECFMMGGN